MIKKTLSIFKFLIAFIVALAVLTEVIVEVFFPKTASGFGIQIDMVSTGIVFVIAGMYVFYLVRTALRNWKNKAYPFNILLIVGTMVQCYVGGVILLRQDYQARDHYFWIQVCFVLVLWAISVYDTICVFKGLKRKSNLSAVS